MPTDTVMPPEEPPTPPEPQLLDTSVIQALDWVDELREAERPFRWTDDRVRELEERYGRPHAAELLDLGSLYVEHEWRGGYPWLVCASALREVQPLREGKGERVRNMLAFIRGHQDDWSHDAYPGVALGMLFAEPLRPSLILLRGLGVNNLSELTSDAGPLGFLPDLGDRAVARDALLAGVPAVLTLDRRTFWHHRLALDRLGVRVFLPGELLDAYEARWAWEDDMRSGES